MTKAIVFASMSCVLMAGAALATDQPDQNAATFAALPGISAVAMTDDALAAIEGQSAEVINPDGPAHFVLTPSGRANQRFDQYGPGDHSNYGAGGAQTDKQGAHGPNNVYTPSGNFAGSGFRP